MLSNHFIICHPLLLLLSIFPIIRVFSNELDLCIIRWPQYWSFSTNEYSGLISLRIDWFDFLVVQETLKHLLQYYSLKASIRQCSAFFMVQLSHPYMTTGKTIALTIWTFVGKVMSLIFNMLSKFDITFLPRSKHLLISCLQLLSTVILEPKKMKSVTVSTFPPSICLEVMELDVMILVFGMLSFKPAFSPFYFTLIKRLFSSSSVCAIRVVSSAYLREGNGIPLQYSCLENPMDGEACRLQSMGSQRVGHDWAISLHFTRLVIAFLPGASVF